MKFTISVFLACLATRSLIAGPPVAADEIEATLRRATPLEMPTTAAGLVRVARPADRIPTATNVVVAAVRINPVANLAIVGAIVRGAPGTAPAVAAAAAREQPSQAPDIARAAAAIAPDRAGEIVMAIGRATSGELHSVALAASRVAPEASRAILQAVGTARPELAPFIQIEINRCGENRPPVSSCLDRAEDAQVRESAKPLNPSAPGNSGSRPPHGPGPPPPGGRNYARP